MFTITENCNEQLPLITTNSRPSESLRVLCKTMNALKTHSNKHCRFSLIQSLQSSIKTKRKTAGLKIWLLYLTQTMGFNAGWVYGIQFLPHKSHLKSYMQLDYNTSIPIPKREIYHQIVTIGMA